MSAPIPITLQSGAPPSVADWMQPVAALPNPPPGQGYSLPGNVPVELQSGAPPSTQDWMQRVVALPNPAGNPVQNLSGWYPSTNSVDYKKNGAPVGGPWVEQLDPKLPARGLLHRQGAPDAKVQILWNSGCELRPGGSHVCNVYAQELGPADLIRFRLPSGQQGRAMGHRVYKTPGGNYTPNPRALQTKATYKKAWLPASYTEQKPSGIRGTWVQVSNADPQVGIVHIPGMGTQNAYVSSVQRDPYGRFRAEVRWRSPVNANPRPSAGAPDAYLVQTTIDKGKWYCRVLPKAADCVRHDITKGTAAPNPALNPAPNPNGEPLGLQRPGRAPVSPAAARARVASGGIVEAIRSGAARLVLDRRGIKLVA